MTHATNNPIIAAYLDTTTETVEEREANEMFISPEEEWLQYIEHDLIGFEYTRAHVEQAVAFIDSRRGEES